jgi:FdhD protein
MADASARRPVTPVRVREVAGADVRERPDRLVTEEPMEIRVQGPRGEPVPVAVTMRTPGNDYELAVGFLHSEGLIRPTDVASVAYCLAGEGEQEYNVVTVRTRGMVDIRVARSFTVNASCGLCGKTTLDEIEVACPPLGPGPVIDRSVLVDLPVRLRDAQSVFDVTGGLHAAACFDVGGSATVVREDVGRHNALDKVVGWAALERRLPLSDQVLLVSGRVSFEIVQKAAVAGIPIVCAVSAPSSLAVDAAARLGQTIVGFLRDDHFNVYAGAERVDVSARARES